VEAASNLYDLGYLVAAALFIFGLKYLSSPRTAPLGNSLGAFGMLVAVVVTLLKMSVSTGIIGWPVILAGLVVGGLIGGVMAKRVEMTGMPEMVALFNGFGGGASVAAGNFDDDGIPDIVVGAGPGGGPHVRAFDGATGQEIHSFFAYEAAFTGGITVAAGDVNDDGVDDPWAPKERGVHRHDGFMFRFTLGGGYASFAERHAFATIGSGAMASARCRSSAISRDSSTCSGPRPRVTIGTSC